MKGLDELNAMWAEGREREVAVIIVEESTCAQSMLCAVKITVEHGEAAGRRLVDLVEAYPD